MSWDAVLMRVKGKPRSIEEIDGDELPLGPRAAVLAAIRKQFPTAAQQSPSELLYTDGNLSIAFQLVGRSPVDSVILEVRGQGDPITPLLQLATANGWSVLDGSSSEFLDSKRPSNHGYGEYRKAVKQIPAAPAAPRRAKPKKK